MKFSGKEDVEAPIEAVFRMLSDFDRFERLAIRRGIEVTRQNSTSPASEGLTWDTEFQIRGKARHVQVVLGKYRAPTLMRFDAASKGMSGHTQVELVALSPRRTRLLVDIDFVATTLPARLLLQSLKLGKSRLRRRFRLRLAEFAGNMEQRYSQSG